MYYSLWHYMYNYYLIETQQTISHSIIQNIFKLHPINFLIFTSQFKEELFDLLIGLINFIWLWFLFFNLKTNMKFIKS
jgi:hypothetical protein